MGVVGWFFVVLWGFVGCVLGVIVVWFDFGVGGCVDYSPVAASLFVGLWWWFTALVAGFCGLVVGVCGCCL